MGDVKKISCLFCEGSHESPLRIKAKGMSVDDRREKVKTSKACFTCLKRGHGAAKCKLRLKCLKCSKKHYELLYPELSKPSTQKVKQASSKVGGGSDDYKSPKGAQDCSNAQSTLTNLVCKRGILLCTQLVKIVYCGKEHVVCALYYSGGQCSYIQTSTATSLNLTPCGSEVLARQLFGGKTLKPLKHKFKGT